MAWKRNVPLVIYASMIICGVDLKYINNNQWVDDDGDDGGDDHRGGDGDKNGKNPKIKISQNL